MSRHLRVTFAAGAAGAVVAAAIAALPQAVVRDVLAGTVPSQSDPSPCIVTHTKTASPEVLLLGETVDITLTARALCPVEPLPLHIVLVLDGSSTMAGQKSQQMKQAAARLIRGLDMPSHTSIKVGVVQFNAQAVRLCNLTNDENQAVGCVNRVGANGATRIDLGILEGLRLFRQGRSGLNRDELTEVMVVLSDGGNDAGCAPVLAAARQVRSQGILVIAVCVGNDCDEQCMRQVASGPRYYFRAENAGQLQAIFDHIRNRILGIELRMLTVHDALPDWMEYVPESAEPPQSSPEYPDQWLKWEDVYVPSDGVTYTFEVKPLKTGYVPTNVEATGELVDNRGRSKAWLFEQPWVTVLQAEARTPMPNPSPMATPTATLGGATASPTTPTAPTATPIATSTTDTALYFPRAVRLE